MDVKEGTVIERKLSVFIKLKNIISNLQLHVKNYHIEQKIQKPFCNYTVYLIL